MAHPHPLAEAWPTLSCRVLAHPKRKVPHTWLMRLYPKGKHKRHSLPELLC